MKNEEIVGRTESVGIDYFVKKNPYVITIAPIFGAKVGTILNYDFDSGKYVSVEEKEDVGDNTYFYSGSAIAVDPVLVDSYMGEVFEMTTVEEEIIDPGKVVKAYEEEINKDKVDPDAMIDGPEKDEAENEGTPFIESKQPEAFLVTECQICGNVDFVAEVKGGLTITLPVGSEDATVMLTCGNCGASIKLKYVYSDPRKEPEAEITEKIKGNKDESQKESK